MAKTAMEALDDLIQQQQRKLEFLREEFDRLDANHPQQSLQVSRDIHELVVNIQTLQKFKVRLSEPDVKE